MPTLSTSPIPRLQADLVAAEAYVARLEDILLDAKRVCAETAAQLARAVAADPDVDLFDEVNAFSRAFADELRAEKAAGRRRDAEADRADAVAELREVTA